MDLRLSWDLFIIVFFAIVAAYSLIIGRQGTLKIVISTYIAILTADGVGNVVSEILAGTTFVSRFVGFLGFGGGIDEIGALAKIILFIAAIVTLTIHGDYYVEDPQKPEHPFVKMTVLAIVSVLSGGLTLSAILVFANGGSLIEGTTGISDSFIRIYQESGMVRHLLDYHDIWFAAPGIAFIMVSIFQKNSNKAA